MASRHGELLLRKLDERHQELLEALGAGVPDWDAYNRLVGEIAGTINAKMLSQDADEELT